MLQPVLTSAPTKPVITIGDVKNHCVVEHPDDDSLITAMIEAARTRLDGYAGVLGRCLVSQNWQVSTNDWPASGCMRLPFPDVSAIVSVKYYDATDVETTVSATLYELLEDHISSFIRFRDDFTDPDVYDDRRDGVQVVFTAGYGDPKDVPQAIRIAMTMMVCDWYEHRSNVEPGAASTLVPIPAGSEQLLAPYRRNII